MYKVGLVMNEKPHLDEEALAELQDVMEDDFDILISTYLSDSRDRIEALRSALRSADADSFTRSAHSFKGSSVNIGAPRLGAICMEAEVAGREGRLGQADNILEVMEREFNTISNMLERTLRA